MTYRPWLGRFAIGATTLALWSATLLPVRAAEQITVTYQDIQITVSLDELENFAQNGTLPAALATLFNSSQQVPANVRSALIREIQVPKVIDRFLATSSGEFALIQLEEAIQDSNRRDNLNALRTSMETAGADRQISVLELLAAYPETRVTLDVSQLESTYNRVSNFVERVQPVLDLAIDALQNLICDCDPETGDDAGSMTGNTRNLNGSETPESAEDLSSSHHPSHSLTVQTASTPCNTGSTFQEAAAPVSPSSTLLAAESDANNEADPAPKLPIDPVQPPAPWAAKPIQPIQSTL
ncbi:MAG: alpha/beta hydrolase [Prochlorothrix sp.]|nr:alpha/beta hydrolase [Prochlorothrix sp.]